MIITADRPLASAKFSPAHLWLWLSTLRLCFLPELYPVADPSVIYHWSAVLRFSKHSAEKCKSQPLNLCFFSCFPSALAVWTDKTSVLLSLTLYILVLAVGPDDWWWMNCSGTFVGHSTKHSAYVPPLSPGFLNLWVRVWKVLWAAADGRPHGNTNNNFTEPASKDENVLKLGRKCCDVA